MEFFADHINLIMGNYQVKPFFIILSKKMWLIGICHTFLYNFGDPSIKDSDVWYGNNAFIFLLNMTIITLC